MNNLPGENNRDDSTAATPSRLCAACPVLQGECPICGTFWILDGGKRHGLTPVQRQAFDGPTSELFSRSQLGNFVDRPVTDADIQAARERLDRVQRDIIISPEFRRG
jgi:hypothetical protein